MSSGVDTCSVDGVFDDTKADLNIRVRESSYRGEEEEGGKGVDFTGDRLS